MFCESVVDFEFEGALHPPRTLTNDEAKGFVWAAHHYDVVKKGEECMAIRCFNMAMYC